MKKNSNFYEIIQTGENKLIKYTIKNIEICGILFILFLIDDLKIEYQNVDWFSNTFADPSHLIKKIFCIFPAFGCFAAPHSHFS